MLPHATLSQESSLQEIPSPLDANRTWYRGQWIDCRDTVNEWLEATIVEIVRPQDILPLSQQHQPQQQQQQLEEKEDKEPKEDDKESLSTPRILEPATDPAVSAGDMEGRRRLLLEPCDMGDAGDLGDGYRPRATNAGARLLLVHYNGWPHRWDEWIRSDSERIRPFRTRTRHPSMVRFGNMSEQTFVYCPIVILLYMFLTSKFTNNYHVFLFLPIAVNLFLSQRPDRLQ
jgi:hypothetical protein